MKKITLEEMSLEQKVSFVLCMRRLRNEDDINYILDLVKRRAVTFRRLSILEIPMPSRLLITRLAEFSALCPMSQEHTIDVLAGSITPTGKMPIKLNLR